MGIQSVQHILVDMLVHFLWSQVNMNKLHIQLMKVSNDYLLHMVMGHMDLLPDDDHKLKEVVFDVVNIKLLHRLCNLVDNSKLDYDSQLYIRSQHRTLYRMDLYIFDGNMIFLNHNLD